MNEVKESNEQVLLTLDAWRSLHDVKIYLFFLKISAVWFLLNHFTAVVASGVFWSYVYLTKPRQIQI